MNKALLHKDVQEFINENLNANLSKLILKGSPFSEATVQELAQQIQSKSKAKEKLPTWFSTSKIYYPPKLNIEQTSSEKTADYKATLVSGKKLIDLTGGFGVDSYYFSKAFEEVFHCEINSEISEICQYNAEQLQTKNMRFYHKNGIDFISETSESFDVLYIDPSRRTDAKGKVFLIEDCEPNIIDNIDIFLSKAQKVLVKLSPMLDISDVLKKVKNIHQVHVVAVENEVKELLILIEQQNSNKVKIVTINQTKHGNQYFDFMVQSNPESTSENTYQTPLKFLYEPNAAILKSGGFQQICNQYSVSKLHQHSHLYTNNERIDFPGRSFKILNVFPFDNKSAKSKLKNLKANVTTRNFPMTVAQIRKRFKMSDGGDKFIFFTKDVESQLIVIVCSRLSNIN